MHKIVLTLFLTTFIHGTALFGSDVDGCASLQLAFGEVKLLELDLKRILRQNGPNDGMLSEFSTNQIVKRIENIPRTELFSLLHLLQKFRQLRLSQSIVERLDLVIQQVLSTRGLELDKQFNAIIIELLINQDEAPKPMGMGLEKYDRLKKLRRKMFTASKNVNKNLKNSPFSSERDYGTAIGRRFESYDMLPSPANGHYDPVLLPVGFTDDFEMQGNGVMRQIRDKMYEGLTDYRKDGLRVISEIPHQLGRDAYGGGPAVRYYSLPESRGSAGDRGSFEGSVKRTDYSGLSGNDLDWIPQELLKHVLGFADLNETEVSSGRGYAGLPDRIIKILPTVQIVFFHYRGVVLALVFFPVQYNPSKSLELLSLVAQPYTSVNIPR